MPPAPGLASPTTTILLVGAGLSQCDAIRRLRETGMTVVAVDGDPDAPGLREASVAEVVDFSSVPDVIEVGRRRRVGGVMTVASDRAVPVVAAVAEALGLPGIGLDTARVMTNKIAMRERLAAHGVPQPRFVPLRAGPGAKAPNGLGFPAVLKPADSGGQRGLFRLEGYDELEERLPQTLSYSAAGEAILEEFHEGIELNAMAVVRGGETVVVTLSDRLRPPGAGFGVGWTHLYPTGVPPAVQAEAERVAAAAIAACGLRDGIAFPQLLAGTDGSVRVVEIGARIAAGEMSRLVRHAVGLELVDVALLQALGRAVPDELVRPRFSRPVAICFLTGPPGVLAPGTVRRVGSLDEVRRRPGVLAADLYLRPGETIGPVQLDIDRRGYVLATGATPEEALARARDAARLVPVEVG